MPNNPDILIKSRQIKRKKKIGLFLLPILAIFFVFILSIIVLRLKALEIGRIEVAGTEIVTAEEVKQNIRETIAGNYFYVYPKSSIFLYPKEEMVAQLLSRIPRVKSAEIEFADIDAVKVTITERRPAIVWCAGGEEERCYFADDVGFVFAPAPIFSENVFYTVSGNLPADPVGKFASSAKDLQEITVFLHLLGDLARNGTTTLPRASTVVVNEEGEYEAIVRERGATASSTWKIFFKGGQEPKELVQNLLTIVESDAFRKETGGNLSKLEYIDLRFGKKVFYKLK